ncbi:MAG TPA: DUF4159 domain-containing protein [Tepidisphaeraceae bacterium]|jgi:hypothetical protein|nr:DUF4159 domain-containing protein [Tepidisphaeraceae bacterium]
MTGEAGLPALCSACGTRYRYPPSSNGAQADGRADNDGSPWRAALPWLCAAVAVVAMATIAWALAQRFRPPPGATTPIVRQLPKAPPPVAVPVAPARAPGESIAASVPEESPSLPPMPAVSEPADLFLELPPVRPLHIDGGLTDQQISASIHRAVDFLMRDMDQHFFEVRDHVGDRSGYHAGLDALCVYALIMAGQTVNDPRLSEHGTFITGCLDRLKQMSMDGRFATYAHALQAIALAALNRPEDHKVLQADADWLIGAAHNGAYSYDAFTQGVPEFDADRWDNSNSQYGLLGVWAASEAGIAITPGYWEVVQKHWVSCQLRSGEFPYHAFDARLSMTCAGLASLFVTQEHLRASQLPGTATDPASRALQRGLAWLEMGNNSVDVGRPGWPGYTYYGIERVGLASGYKYFGTHDWYRELAGQLIDEQREDGTWPAGDVDVNGAFCLLFLARGSHPIIMNKLRFPGHWNARPDDLVHLARYAGDQLERPLNWQVVPVDHGWQDWTDSPVLYISSDSAPQLTEDQEQGLKSFVENGGLLFTSSVGQSSEFDDWATKLAHRLFPNYPMQPVPTTGNLFNVVIKLSKNPSVSSLRLRAVSNGARLLMIHSDTDLSHAWQQRHPADTFPFDLGLNLAVYATGKAELRNRLSSLYVPPISAKPLHTMTIARLRYGGNWNPEPDAWERFGRVFQLNTSWGIKTTDVDIEDLKPGFADIAVLTGTDAYTFTPDQSAALARFVKAGGVLFVDVCGGRDPFEQSVADQLLPQTFGDIRPHRLSGESPLVSAPLPGMTDCSRPHIRQYADQSIGFLPTLPRIERYGYGHMIFSPLDMTSGLLGTGTWGISGYTADYSLAFMQNLMLWTARGQAD